MIKRLVFAALAILMASSAILEAQQTSVLKENRDLPSFEKIKATKGINITLIEGTKQNVEVNIRNAALGDVITTVENKTLVLKMKTKIYKNMAVQVYVTYTKLREIDAGMGASVDAENTIVSDNLKISAGAETNLELEVEVKNALEVSLGAAKATITGTAKYQDVTANTGSSYNAFDLECDEAFVKANTGATIQVSASTKLKATAATGGVVEYKGSPAQFEYKESLGGKVIKVD